MLADDLKGWYTELSCFCRLKYKLCYTFTCVFKIVAVLALYIVYSNFIVDSMAGASPENFDIGDWVVCRGELCKVVDIQATHLGYRSFVVQNFDTGVTNNVSKHELIKAVLQDITLLKEDWDDDIPEFVLDTAARPATVTGATSSATAATATATAATGTAPTATSSRHAILDDTEMDEIAKARLSHNSEKQTMWAVALLRGKKFF